jgi:hypothetical protein
MPTPGYVFKDGETTPPSTPPPTMNESTTPKEAETPLTRTEIHQLEGLEEAPTESHALATAGHEEKGAAQEDHSAHEVKDLGWHAHPNDTPTLVGGLPNEELWILIRRFNKVREPPRDKLRIISDSHSANVPRQSTP